MPSPDREFLAVERPTEAEDLFGGKLGDLTAGLPVQRLQPQITDVVFRADHIDKCEPVRSEPWRSTACHYTRVYLEHAGRRAQRIGVNDCHLVFVRVGGWIRHRAEDRQKATITRDRLERKDARTGYLADRKSL